MVLLKKFRNFAITDFSVDNLRYYVSDIQHLCSYIILGKEKCATTLKEHIQGFIIFKSARTFKQVKNLLPAKVHIEKTYAAAVANIKYCSKDGNLLLEFGTRPSGQGRRSDFVLVRDMLTNGATMREVCENVTSYQAVRSAEIILKYLDTPRPIQRIEIIWIWGKTGVGKTSSVWKEHPNLHTMYNYKWWDGYDAHEVVLLDDIREEFCSYRDLLRITDIYPFRVENKGGFRHVQFTKMYITAPFPPRELFPEFDDKGIFDSSEFLRRITKIIHLE